MNIKFDMRPDYTVIETLSLDTFSNKVYLTNLSCIFPKTFPMRDTELYHAQSPFFGRINGRFRRKYFWASYQRPQFQKEKFLFLFLLKICIPSSYQKVA